MGKTKERTPFICIPLRLNRFPIFYSQNSLHVKIFALKKGNLALFKEGIF